MKPIIQFSFLAILLFSNSCAGESDDSKGLKDNGSEHSDTTNVIVTEPEIIEEVFDVSKVKITLARGAFHYDSFQLIGNDLTYIPSSELIDEGYPEYQSESTVTLADSVVESLFKYILENDILELDEHYDNMTSCNSMLKVEIIMEDVEKAISCSDFERGCPEVLFALEGKLIELHGKNLKRVLLPG